MKGQKTQKTLGLFTASLPLAIAGYMAIFSFNRWIPVLIFKWTKFRDIRKCLFWINWRELDSFLSQPLKSVHFGILKKFPFSLKLATQAVIIVYAYEILSAQLHMPCILAMKKLYSLGIFFPCSWGIRKTFSFLLSKIILPAIYFLCLHPETVFVNRM